MNLGLTSRAIAALLVTASVVACTADGSNAGRDADVEEFCEVYTALYSGGMAAVDPAAPRRVQHRAMATAFREWAAEMVRVGAPDAMSPQAEEGFDLVVQAAADLDAGAGDLAALDDGFTADQVAATEAFDRFATQHCASPPAGSPTP